MAEESITIGIAELRGSMEACWDAHPENRPEFVRASPVVRFAAALHRHDSGALRWLTYYVARRALPCWDIFCEGKRPRQVTDAIGEHLSRGTAVEWKEATTPTPSEVWDCRYVDAQNASDAVAHCAAYLHTGDPLHAGFCLSAADVAYDHALSDHRFREWLVEVAIPVALEHREMSADEMEALRPTVEPANTDSIPQPEPPPHPCDDRDLKDRPCRVEKGLRYFL
jgi:hypothetical protein